MDQYNITIDCENFDGHFEFINTTRAINLNIICQEPSINPLLFDIFGWVGTIGIIFTYLPQVIKVYKTKSTIDVSIKFLIIGMISCSLIIVYGVLFNLMPLYVGNPIIFIESALLLGG